MVPVVVSADVVSVAVVVIVVVAVVPSVLLLPHSDLHCCCSEM